MRIVAAVILSSLMVGGVAGAQSTGGQAPLTGGPAAPRVPPPPADQTFGPPDQMFPPGGQPDAPTLRSPEPVAPEATGDPGEQANPDGYAADIDYDVAYDDSVAQSYDDGYDPQAYQQFQETLAPYGSWVDDPSYGRVWVPSAAAVGDDFSPYATNGDWMSTEYGWTWVSAFDWGWAPFHYGRWALGANRGWCWVPGTLWGPGWVSWRAGGGYVGWAPMPPRRLTVGSPLGAGSPWRFTLAGDLGHAHRPYLPAEIVPRIFDRMNVVSNPRTLLAGRATVRVNAGPPRTGGPLVGSPPGSGPLVGSPPAASARLATVAPQALPRFVIQPHAGAPITARPWVRAGVVQQGPTASLYASRAGSFSAPSGARAATSDGRFQGQPVTRAYRAPAVYGPAVRPAYGGPSAAYRAPAYRAAPVYQGAPAYRAAPVYRAQPVYRPAASIAPRSAGGFAPHYAAPSFSHSSAPAFHGGGGGGGGGMRSFGGGRRR